jgi:hypothetical protein
MNAQLFAARRQPHVMRLLALAAAAAIALAGCGSHAAASSPTGRASVAAAPTCRQQYETWKHDTAAKAVGKRLVAALRAVQSAGGAEDFPRLESSLKQAGAPAAKLAGFPMPKCADPKGYWAGVLTRVRAASDNVKSSSGLASIMLAEVPLKGLPKIEKKLDRELNRTVGKKR